MVTVINDAAENSGFLSNNPCAQGAFEGRGPVAKETDEIQNGPRATVLLSSLSLFFWPPTYFCFLSLNVTPFVSEPAAALTSVGFWQVSLLIRLGVAFN